MDRFEPSFQKFQRFSILTALFVLITAASILYGWLSHSVALITIFPVSAPVQPNTALSFTLIGLSLLFAFQKDGGFSGSTSALAPLVISLMTITEYIFKMDFGIHHIPIPKAIHANFVTPAPMSLNSAVAIFFLSYALFDLHITKNKIHAVKLAVLAVSAASIGLISLLGYYFGIENAYGWAGYTKISPFAALLCGITATSLVSLLFAKENSFSSVKSSLTTMFALVLGLVASILTWAWATAEQSNFIRAQIQYNSEASAQLIQNTISAEIELLESIERFFAGSSNVTREEFQTFTVPLISQYPSLAGIDWAPLSRQPESKDVDTYSVLYTEPFEKNKAALGFNHYSDPLRAAAMDAAIKDGNPKSTRFFTLFRFPDKSSMNSDFLLFVPSFKTVNNTKVIFGFVVGIFRAPALIKEALENVQSSISNIQFYDRTSEAREPFYTYSVEKNSQIIDNEDYNQEEILKVAGREWRLVYQPSDSYLRMLRTWYPSAILLSSLLLTFFISSYIFILRKRNEQVQGLAHELQVESERQAEIILAQQEIAYADENVDSIMKVLIHRMQKTTRAAGALIELVEEDEMVYRAVSGTAEPYLGMRIKVNGSLSGRCVTENDVLRCDDSEIDPRVDKVACRKVGLRSMVVVPLAHEGKAIGVLKVLSPKPNAFTDRDVVSLQLLSGIMSVALAKASAMDQMAKATAFKSQFLANMSHEIRTPLTSIIGYAESLKEGDLPTEDISMAHDTIVRNSKHLLGIINDILDLSKIEAGKLDIDRIETSLFDVISDVENLMQHRAMEQGIEFRFDFEFPLPKTIYTDPLRLKQILINLIGNAIKFTKRGSVHVKVTPDAIGEQLSFAVTDTGIGLTPEQLKKLFQAFSQADTSTTRKFGGTGLGLIISSQLAEKLGGTIRVESTPNVGSTFTVIINTGSQTEMCTSRPPRTQEAPRPSALIPRLAGKVLFVEDGTDNQRYISFILKKAELDFSYVENGALALEAVEKDHFDLILMDMQMPVMDGYTATQQLRERGYSVPIIALTANTLRQDVDRCLAAGCTDFLGKPFDRRAFYQKLTQYLDSKIDNQDELPPLFAHLEDRECAPIVLEFVDKLEGRIAEISEALRVVDTESLAMLSHRLRAASMFGYPLLGDTAGEIEDAVRSGSLDTAADWVHALQQIGVRIKKGRTSLVPTR